MKKPLVSVIVTTKNNQATLDACLASIAAQTYKPIELIVVDNDSADGTLAIARQYTENVLTKTPERSIQRNFGVEQATGRYVAIIDSDMELERYVIEECVAAMQFEPQATGVIIPEESFGRGFWAKCKSLERSFYVGIDAVEAARFFERDIYMSVGGYDETMVSGEDWDLSRRVGKLGEIVRVTPYIHHNEGRLSLVKTLKKKVYYAGEARKYFDKNPVESKLLASEGPLARYKLFFSRPGKLLRNPITAAGMLFMKTAEYAFGGLGYVLAGLSVNKEKARMNG
jgi:glycosyltransferase involved in cell wall biosynthesis